MKTVVTLSIVLSFLLGNVASQARMSVVASSVEMTQVPANLGPRSGHCPVYDEQRCRVILFGDYVPPSKPALEEMWRWDGKQWTQIK